MKAQVKMCFLVIVFFLASSPLFAASNGSSLLKNCREAVRFADNQYANVNFLEMGMCLGMINGTNLTMKMYQEFTPEQFRACVPGDVNNGQIARVVVKLLEEYPQRHHENDVKLIVDSLRATFPCQR